MRVQNIWVDSIIYKTCLSKSQGKLICLFLLALWRLGDGSKVSSSLATIILRNAGSHFLSQFYAPEVLGKKKSPSGQVLSHHSSYVSKQDCYLADTKGRAGGSGSSSRWTKGFLSVPNKLVLGDPSFEILIDTGGKDSLCPGLIKMLCCSPSIYFWQFIRRN